METRPTPKELAPLNLRRGCYFLGFMLGLLGRKSAENIPGETIISENLTKVVDQLARINGEKPDLTEWIKKRGIKILFVIGEAGIGKTTINQQLAEKLEKEGINTNQVHLDGKAKLRTLENNGNISMWDWNNNDWATYNQDLYKEIMEAVEAQQDNGVTIVDIPGFLGESGMGREVMEALAANPDYQKKIGILGIIPDSTTQIITGGIRYLMCKKPPKTVEKFLQTHNTWVSWKASEYKEASDEKKGEALQSLASIAANRTSIAKGKETVQKHIESIRKTYKYFDKIAYRYFSQLINANFFHIDRSGRKNPIDRAGLMNMARKAAYLHMQINGLVNQGLPLENTKLVVNPYNAQIPIVWIIKYSVPFYRKN